MEAITAARDLIPDRVRAGKDLNKQQFELCDETGKLLVIITLQSVIGLS